MGLWRLGTGGSWGSKPSAHLSSSCGAPTLCGAPLQGCNAVVASTLPEGLRVSSKLTLAITLGSGQIKGLGTMATGPQGTATSQDP